VGGIYAIWWCVVWRAGSAAWALAGILLALSWVGTEIGYRLVWTDHGYDPPQRLKYVLAVGGAVAVHPYIGDTTDDVLRWQQRWFIPIALSGFVVPFVALGWQGLFAAGFVRFLMHRYGLPAMTTVIRVALDRVGRRLGISIPYPDTARTLSRTVRAAARLGRRIVPTTA
jgi:fatty-acid desaturase